MINLFCVTNYHNYASKSFRKFYFFNTIFSTKNRVYFNLKS
jgi:hypothetical protein